MKLYVITDVCIFSSTAARLLGLWVQNPQVAWLSFLNVVCCHVEISETGQSLAQSPTEFGVFIYVKSRILKNKPTGTVDQRGKSN
jgi:hypothetical protein